MEKTKLLEYVLQLADDLRREEERGALTANYFVIALCDAILSEREGKLPEGLDSREARVELGTAEVMLEETVSVSGELRVALLAATRQNGYDPRTDEFLFRKALFRVRENAKAAGATSIHTALYLRTLLESPTAILKKQLLLEGENGTVTPTVLPPFPRPRASVGEEKPGAATPPPQPPAEEETAFSLADAVRRTGEIQAALLRKVVGQDLAVSAFAAGYFQGQMIAATEKERRGPLATFLFAGPPGVGKTFLAETAAAALGLPFLRADMSEYADNDSLVEFSGSDNVYKNGKEGNITRFIRENPKCVILFDEIEKAHLCIIHLFLQILDSGEIRDNYTDKQVSFGDAIIIFTTNVGRKLYEDPTVANLAMIPRRQVLDALATEVDPERHTLMFPTAICSRFASGNVLMFNRLGTDNLYAITKREIERHTKAFESSSNIKVELDEKIPTALIFAAGGRADARTVKGRAATIFHEEMYELFRLMMAADRKIEDLRRVRIELSLDKCPPEAAAMFVNPERPLLLLFGTDEVAERYRRRLPSVEILNAETIDAAKGLLYQYDFSLILCDVSTGARSDPSAVLNLEDVESEGREFLTYVLASGEAPVYLLEEKKGSISHAEHLSFARMGVREVLALDDEKLEARVLERCEVAYQQDAILRLGRESKVLSYRTSQSVSEDGKEATISFFHFRLARATDADDAKSVLDAASKPNVRFSDVIGAEDAKRELAYFVEYLKDPRKYARRGLHAPKGVLLYGPPGTGKTMLAKATAGESDVTFLTTEGNRFLKKWRGEGPEAVHELFRTARKYAPAIIFVDEIDAIGKDRNDGENDDRVGDILTAFLTEMDGFTQDTGKPVFVLAATNYAVEKGEGAKTLDPALLRRFDRRIYVDLPNKEERRRYCEMRVSKSPSFCISKEQLDNIALRSVGMSLALLESVFEMALRKAVHSLDGLVNDAALEEAFETFVSGEKRTCTPESVARTACHEAGHALLCWLGGECPSYLTVVSRGDHGGYMQHGDNEEKGVYSREELLAHIRTSLGGRAAELVYYGEEAGVTTGPSADLASATRVAESMICRYGMDERMGLASFSANPAGTPFYAELRARINEILDGELTRAIDLIEKNRPAMDALIAALVEKNQLKGDEIDAILAANAKR